MSKADRLERLDLRRMALEADYRATLVTALETAASGSWGLFDHRNDRAARARIAPVIANLTELAVEADACRAQLGVEPFALHRRFIAARGPVPSSAMGEPRQARVWLDQLALEQDATKT